MCLIYFADHHDCDHHHLLGAWNCGLNCPTNARHTFYLNDNGYCMTCVFLRGQELDPETNPVTYCPPLFDVDKFPGTWKEEEEPKFYVPSVASLSDPDSLTSEWRCGPSATAYDYTAKPQQDTYSNNMLSAQMTPQMAAHRTLVQDQLRQLPVRTANAHPTVLPSMRQFYVPGGFQATVGPMPFRVPVAQNDEGKEKEE